jgi:uncharacterized protein (DUF362 family)
MRRRSVCTPSALRTTVHSGSNRLSRRAFLEATAGGVLLTSCARPPYRASDFTLPGQSPVCLYPAPDYEANFIDLIARGLKTLGIQARGKRVLLKPNLVEHEDATPTAINTHASIVAGAIEAFRSAGAQEVVVAEGPAHRRDTEYLLEATGLREGLQHLRCPFVDVNYDDVRRVPLRSQFTGLPDLWLPVELLRADLVVSMPKLKTHHWAGLTVGMKNLFGLVPGAVYGWPKNLLHVRGIENTILDLTSTIAPHLTIVDGVVGMEGDGPIMGRPKQTGFIAMGPDVVAVDATCARVMGIDPAKVPYLSVASDFLGNIAEDRIELRGERLSRYQTRFDLLPRFDGIRLG